MTNQKTVVFKFFLINFYFCNSLNAGGIPFNIFGKAVGEMPVVKAYLDPKKAVHDTVHDAKEAIRDKAYVLGYAVVDSSKAAYVAALEHPEITGAVVGIAGAGLVRYCGGSKRDMMLVGCPVGIASCVVTQEMQKQRLDSAISLGVARNVQASSAQLKQGKALESGTVTSLDLSREGLGEMARAADTASALQAGNTGLLGQAIGLKAAQQKLGLAAGAACGDSDAVLAKTKALYKQAQAAREQAEKVGRVHADAARERVAWYAVFMPELGQHVDRTRQAVEDSSKLLTDLSSVRAGLGAAGVRAQAARSAVDNVAALSAQNLALAKKQQDVQLGKVVLVE